MASWTMPLSHDSQMHPLRGLGPATQGGPLAGLDSLCFRIFLDQAPSGQFLSVDKGVVEHIRVWFGLCFVLCLRLLLFLAVLLQT